MNTKNYFHKQRYSQLHVKYDKSLITFTALRTLEATDKKKKKQ